jgi:hypothetical protein
VIDLLALPTRNAILGISPIPNQYIFQIPGELGIFLFQRKIDMKMKKPHKNIIQ